MIKTAASFVFLLFLCSCYKSPGEDKQADADADAAPEAAPDPVPPDYGYDPPVDPGFDDPPYTDVPVPDMGVDDIPSTDVLIDTVPSMRCAEVDADIVVPGDYYTIQGAVDASSSGDLICVEPGVYHEHLRFSGESIHVLGAAGPVHTIVEADFTGTAVRIAGDSEPPLILQGFTIRYGRVYGAEAPGVVIRDASPVLAHVFIVDNIHDSGFGSGVTVEGYSSPTFTNVVIARNETHSGFGGGMLIEGDVQVTMRNVVIADNMTFSGFGGGIQIGQGASLNITNGILAGNHVESGGGGGINVSWETAALSLTNVTFVGNEVLMGPGSAVSIDEIMDDSTFTNVSITENFGDPPMFGALSCNECGPLRILHSNLWGNESMDVDGLADPVGTNGNIAADPGFQDTSSSYALDWDLHCASGSGLVDAGADGILDPDGGPSDIGAFGGPGAASWDLDADGFPAWWQPGPYDHAAYPAMGLDCNDLDPDVKPGSGC